ncbi:unnamed protein product [Rotaria sp. Silwood2]|nr:unnamed protein product [Rotaria sp. Silwood2]CAF3327496.1 unnamed protein product [Rotaria sp. Silwood2]CAF4453570.1 unnamed protein product [Rotaria sp. Silwood2]CAF4479255.1 unnamed protein product [Rotaria sp. Silwood2]
MWLSAFVAVEHGLMVYSDGKTNITRWRSFISIIFMFAIAVASGTPMIVYNCDWNSLPRLKMLRGFFNYYYPITGFLIYVLAAVLISISLKRRIHQYGTENGSFIKTFLKLLYLHSFVFVPMIAYIVSYIPYTIVINMKNSNQSYFQCGISTGEFIIKVLIETLQGIPTVLTWLLFVYPSKEYMAEFYTNTWSGQRLAKILIFFKGNSDREKHPSLSNKDYIHNEHNDTELTHTNI